MLYAVRGNISLFYHRNVTPFDEVLARMAVEIFGNWGAAVFSFFVLYSIGSMGDAGLRNLCKSHRLVIMI